VTDERVRDLERRWLSSGSVEDHLAYLSARARLGDFIVAPTARLDGGARLAASAFRWQARGVLEFGSFSSPAPGSAGLDAQDLFRNAVLTMFQHLQEEDTRRIEEYCRRSGIPPDEYVGYRLRLESSAFEGQPISLREFLGWEYDLERRCLALKGQTSAHLNDYFLAPYLEDARHLCDYTSLAAQWDPHLDLEEAHGYAYAFSRPPYGLGLPNVETDALFHTLSHCLFGGLSEDLEIWRWETHWTNYFEAGREWWGEYLWTVHRPGSGRVVVIAGSSTD
jgi:hypothetical protein